MAVGVAMRDYLRRRAAWVWNEQGHAFNHGLSLQEETLTEMLLLRMARDHGKHGLTVTMFNKTEEAINGADWEWIIRTRGCELALRIQAKRLYHANSKKDYGGLDPKSGQSAKLIAQARKCIPVYVFFNHNHGKSSSLLNGGGENPYRGRSYWGCSIACAKKVQAKKSNTLSDLKPIMKPWRRMISKLGDCNTSGALGIDAGDMKRSMSQERREVVERIRDRDFMSQFLIKEELVGVAVLDFTDFRSS
jgi:hypothetical protein